MKYVFIQNPISGNKNKQLLFKEVQSAFRLSDDDMVIEETQHVGHAAEISARYAQEYGENCVIVSCGGDGTVHEIANGIAHTPASLMVLPFGTGNDFAKKLYHSKKLDPYKVVKDFGLDTGELKYKVTPIDLIDYNGEKCMNIMSYGLDTKVETLGRKIAGKVKFLGQMAYNIAVVPVIMQPMHYQVNIELNCISKETGEEYTLTKTPLDYALMAICNASYYGGGFCPAPNSVLDDGLLDLAYVEPVSLIEGLPMISKYSAGTLEGTTEKMHTDYVVSGRIWSSDDNALLGNCDGENFDYHEVNFKVEKQAMNLCLPEVEE